MPKLDDAALDTIFRAARSYNGYTDAPVAVEQLHAIWELMKWGPTSANQLPARLVWCTSLAAKQKLADCCSPQNAPKILNAPVTVIIGMDENFHEQLPWLFPHVDAKAWFDGNAELRAVSAMRNSTLQGAYLIIAARALGLDTGRCRGSTTARSMPRSSPTPRGSGPTSSRRSATATPRVSTTACHGRSSRSSIRSRDVDALSPPGRGLLE